MIDQYISGQKPKKTLSNKSNKSSVNNSSSSTSTSSSSGGGGSKTNTLKHGNKMKNDTQSNMNNLLPIHSMQQAARNSPNSQTRYEPYQ